MTDWTIQTSEANLERDFAIGSIVSEEFIKGFTEIYRPELSVSFARWVIDRALEYHKKHGQRAPVKDIQKIFEDSKNSFHSDAERGLVAMFLASISQEYERQEQEFNPSFILERASNYYRKRALEKLKEDLQFTLEGDNIQAALAAVGKFKAIASPQQLGRGWTLSELMAAKFPPSRYIVEDLVTPNFTLFAGRMKVGKSHLLMLLAVSIASGGLFLERYQVEPGEVLIIDTEMHERQSYQKLSEILAAQGLSERHKEWGHKIHIHPKGSWPRMNEGGISKLEDFCQGHPDLKLVIIDVWGLFRPHRKGKADKFNYDLDYEDVSRVRGIINKYDVGVLASHHLGKSYSSVGSVFDAIFGSTGLASAADNLMALATSKGEADAVLHTTGRFIGNMEIALEKDRDTKGWLFLGDASLFESTMDQNAIIQFLSGVGEASPKDIASALGKPVNNVGEMLFRMLKQGKVKRVGYGKYSLPNTTNTPISTNSPNTPNASHGGCLLITPNTTNNSNTTNSPKSPNSSPQKGIEGIRSIRGISSNLELESPPPRGNNHIPTALNEFSYVYPLSPGEKELYGPEVLAELRITQEHSRIMNAPTRKK